jgi:hypothetical protein
MCILLMLGSLFWIRDTKFGPRTMFDLYVVESGLTIDADLASGATSAGNGNVGMMWLERVGLRHGSEMMEMDSAG